MNNIELFLFYGIISIRIGECMKKAVKLCIPILLIIAFISLGKTYSYYIDKSESSSKLKVASWKVVVNKEDITLNNEKNFELTNFKYSSSNDELSKSNNKFAPGMIAEATIEIDPTEIDVAFTYELKIDLSKLNNKNIIIAYVNDDFNSIQKENGIYSSTYDLEHVNNNKKDNVKIGIEWLNNEEDSESDYEFIKNNDGLLKIPLTLNFKQKTE